MSSGTTGFLCSIAEGIRNFVGPREHLKAALGPSEEYMPEDVIMKRPRLSSEIAYVAAPSPKQMVRQNASLDTGQDVSDQHTTLAPPVCATSVVLSKSPSPLSAPKTCRQQSDQADDQSIVLQEELHFDDDLEHSDVTPCQDRVHIDEHQSEHGSPCPFDDNTLDACIGMHTVQNCRPYQEDRAAFMVLDDAIHVGIFDGHAGGETSTYLQENLLNSVYETAKQGIYGADALHRVFMSTNADLRHVKAAYACGSTATTVIVDGSGITCANAGDSPAFIVGTSGEATCLTIDHNPNTNDSERARVEAAGGRIEKMHWGERNKRVLSFNSQSGLAMTRAFGDFNFPGVICDPHITKAELRKEDKFLVLASDGLTEQWTVEGASQMVCELAKSGLNPASIAMQLCYRAMEVGSRDNITVVVLDLQAYIQAYNHVNTST
ncbi:hypothetical protein CEUSTIGMA_g585.t1 [Chlamydomonas eustigma]|uniref:PPM-type phosphatase domain-containing protein n=1 Tax=Chlamydomonas eustigma TaxID=1157962 RepID=A0A250WR34_9CHLO|nr:hypothetical protein CEUSTIGMA_g585.t1 [Chlamydomonas eustigma]|eukprot:GAX73132.1 hypothetical protein CEUSTIGMA_g585.t1 [Chlamydomonas eustigma]